MSPGAQNTFQGTALLFQLQFLQWAWVSIAFRANHDHYGMKYEQIMMALVRVGLWAVSFISSSELRAGAQVS